MLLMLSLIEVDPAHAGMIQLGVVAKNDKIINNYKEKHYIKTGKDNVLILTEADLTIEESEIRKKLIRCGVF